MDVRNQLVEAFLRIPDADRYGTRSSWLSGIDSRPSVRNESVARTDLVIIIDDLLVKDPSGDNLKKFIDNARQGYEATDLGDTLQRLKEQVVKDNVAGTVLREREHVYNLDLIAQELTWVKSYGEVKQGLLGFAVPSESYTLLEVFRDRLQYILGRERVWVFSTIFELNPVHTPAEVAIREIARQIGRLRRNDMLIAVWGANHPPLVEPFWSQLSQKFTGGLQKRLIIMLAVNSGSDIPRGLIRIEPPQFGEGEVYAWVSNIVHSKNWPPDTAVTWINTIKKECSQGPQLVVEQVYLHLKSTLAFLESGVTVEEFLRFLDAQ